MLHVYHIRHPVRQRPAQCVRSATHVQATGHRAVEAFDEGQGGNENLSQLGAADLFLLGGTFLPRRSELGREGDHHDATILPPLFITPPRLGRIACLYMRTAIKSRWMASSE
jgi:hypothetical protein